MKAAHVLEEKGVSVEVIDLRTVVPLDKFTVLESVNKTGRLVVVDPAWKSFGVSAEICAMVAEEASPKMKAGPIRVTFPDTHSPTSVSLERHFFPDEDKIVAAVEKLVGMS